MTPTNTLTAALLETDAAIAARAVADLVAAKLAQDAAEAQRLTPFVRIRRAIADYQERVTGGAWPSYASKKAVREIATAANAPLDVTRHILRHPDSTLGGTA